LYAPQATMPMTVTPITKKAGGPVIHGGEWMRAPLRASDKRSILVLLGWGQNEALPLPSTPGKPLDEDAGRLLERFPAA
jgi:hypothetical protein